MRGQILLQALKTIRDLSLAGENLMAAILSEGYGASAGQLKKAVEKREKLREKSRISAEMRRRYANLIYKLRKEGLVIEKIKNGKKLFRLTGRGESKLKILSEQMPEKKYFSATAPNFTIVAFDIPEKERRKRRWLRKALSGLGLKMLQRSVWFGRVKLSGDFLNDLQTLKILNYIEIFEITKIGTIKQL